MVTCAYFGDYNELLYLRSRYYASSTGRFLIRDTWTGNYNRPMSYNAWLYVSANPVNLIDPSGHCYIDDLSEVCIPHSPSYQPNYGISFTGDWPDLAMGAVYDAVAAVGAKLSTMPALKGKSSAQAFRLVYRNGVTFSWDPGCYKCRPNSYSKDDYHPCIDKGDFGETYPVCKPVGGVTLGKDQIMFATLWLSGDQWGPWNNASERARNNVVHELGHVFNLLAGGQPVQAVTAAYSANYAKNMGLDCYFRENWPKRTNPDYGYYYGFASKYNERTWQMHFIGELNDSNIYSEEFADMFLGWVFNKWEVNNTTHAGTTRSDWMNEYMPGWVNMIVNGQ